MEQEIILEAKNINKSFFGNRVLSNINFDLKRGEVHTILGENGAGKSTLVKILSGVYSKDSGDIIIGNEVRNIENISEAQSLGISMIFQELNILPNLKVYENVFLGKEVSKYGLLNDSVLKNKTKELLGKLKVDINPNEIVENLKISDRQMVEIAKSLSFDAKIIIMDEPTSSLSEKEIEVFFSIIEQLKKDLSISFIFISHRLKEISQISDRITILRDGEYIDTIDLHEKKYNEKEIVKKMVGRDIGDFYVVHVADDKKELNNDNFALEVRNISKKYQYDNISFSIRPGEVLGIAGLVGAGRTEVLNTIMGLNPMDSGEILVFGKKVKIKNPRQAMELGIGYVPEDRRELGIIINMNIRENSSLSILKEISRYQFLDSRKEEEIAEKSVKTFQIKTRGINEKTKYLSGGNQQKVVIAKALNTMPKIILLDEPTRGIDVNAKREIYSIISDLADKGMAIIMVTSELPEIFGISDRILVMHEGSRTGLFNNEEINREKVMNALLGVDKYE